VPASGDKNVPRGVRPAPLVGPPLPDPNSLPNPSRSTDVLGSFKKLLATMCKQSAPPIARVPQLTSNSSVLSSGSGRNRSHLTRRVGVFFFFFSTNFPARQACKEGRLREGDKLGGTFGPHQPRTPREKIMNGVPEPGLTHSNDTRALSAVRGLDKVLAPPRRSLGDPS